MFLFFFEACYERAATAMSTTAYIGHSGEWLYTSLKTGFKIIMLAQRNRQSHGAVDIAKQKA